MLQNESYQFVPTHSAYKEFSPSICRGKGTVKTINDTLKVSPLI